MANTTKQTQALGTFGVYGKPGDELAVLKTANEFRLRLCELYQERHEAMIDFRNAAFPELFAALVRFENIKARIYDLEKAIKAYHSDVRDRNAVTDEQEVLLKQLRAERTEALAEVKHQRKRWSELLKAFSTWWRTLADWKNVKSLTDRKSRYATIQQDLAAQGDPLRRGFVRAQCATNDLSAPGDSGDSQGLTNGADYALLWMKFDLRERDLSAEFAPKLHPAIRQEIIEASQPKTSATSPGMRYQVGRRLELRPWTKATNQFGGGGLEVLDALEGTNQFSIRRVYTNHKGQCDESVYEVQQQIGTRHQPTLIRYRTKIHRALPGDATIQRWTLAVRDNKRVVIPIISGMNFKKPTGSGVFRYELRWTKRKAGIEVARFIGDHVNEPLVIPNWLIDKRMALKATQTACDLEANELLARRGCTPPPNEKQGYEALKVFCVEHDRDAEAANLLHAQFREIRRATKAMQSATRCIEEIYKVVTSRVCRLHDSIVPNELDLTKLKRYDTRDLLKEDIIPPASREILFAVAPGKLKALLNGYGLTKSDQEIPDSDAPVTDVFTGYIQNLGVKTGRKENRERQCSRYETPSEPIKKVR